MNNKIPEHFLKKYGWQTTPSFIVLLFVASTKGYENSLGYWSTMLLGWLIYSMAWMHCYWKYIGEAETINIRAFHYSVFTFQFLFICSCLGYVYLI